MYQPCELVSRVIISNRRIGQTDTRNASAARKQRAATHQGHIGHLQVPRWHVVEAHALRAAVPAWHLPRRGRRGQVRRAAVARGVLRHGDVLVVSALFPPHARTRTRR